MKIRGILIYTIILAALSGYSSVFCDSVLAADQKSSIFKPADDFSLNAVLHLYPFWNGPLEIENIQLRKDGSIELRNITLSDTIGRPWFFADSIQVSFHPGTYSISQLQIYRPMLIIYIEGPFIPIHAARDSRPPAKLNLTLDLLQVHDASITVISYKSHASWSGINFTLTRSSHSFFRFRSDYIKSDYSGSVSSVGAIDFAASTINYEILADYNIASQETSLYFEITDFPVVRSFSGHLGVNLTGQFCPESNQNYWPVGTVSWRDVRVFGDGGSFTDTCSGKAHISSNQAIFENVKAAGLGGTLSASAYYIQPTGSPARYGTSFDFRRIELSRLSTVLRTWNFRAGRASAACNLSAMVGSIESVRAQSVVFLDNADFWNVPGVSQLFEFLKISRSDPLAFSDGIGVFRANGAILTFEIARISGPVAAIIFEKNATFNLQNHYIDAYAVLIPINAIHKTLISIPVIRSFVKLTDMFTRVQVKGDWQGKTSEIVHKQVLTDIRSSAFSFLKSIIKTGSQIPEEDFKSLQKSRNLPP